MSRLFTMEPALVVGFISAILVLLAAFGVTITDAQSAAIVGVVSAGLVLGSAFITRQTVTPNAKVAARRDSSTGAIVSGPADNISPDGTVVTVAPATAPSASLPASEPAEVSTPLDDRIDPSNAEE